MDEETHGELELDETDVRSFCRVKSGQTALSLANRHGADVDGDEIADWLREVPGIDQIDSLVIEPSSRLRDVSVVRGLKGLSNLQVNGLQISTLHGLEWFRGRYLNVDTGKNKKRSIEQLHQAPLEKLTLQYARKEDVDAIGGSSTLRHLEIAALPQVSLRAWHRVPMETLGISSSPIKELAATAEIPALRKLALIRCRSLHALTGDNSRVTWLVVHACRRLDLECVGSFSSLESLFVVDNQQKCRLSSFASLSRLKSLSLHFCHVEADIADLRSAMPSLEQLEISGLDDKKAMQLSRSAPGVSVSTGQRTFMEGQPVR